MVCFLCGWRILGGHDELNLTNHTRIICIYGIDRCMYDFHCGNSSVEYYCFHLDTVSSMQVSPRNVQVIMIIMLQ